MGVQSRIPPQHSVVDETHRKLRLTCGKDTKELGIERFQEICFNDESKLCTVKSGRPCVRLRKSEALPPENRQKRVMFHGGLEVMV